MNIDLADDTFDVLHKVVGSKESVDVRVEPTDKQFEVTVVLNDAPMVGVTFAPTTLKVDGDMMIAHSDFEDMGKLMKEGAHFSDVTLREFSVKKDEATTVLDIDSQG